MAIPKIEQELREATGIEPKDGEKRQAFLVRLMLKALKIDGWDDLSADAQDWVNTAVDKDNEKKAIPDFAASSASRGGDREDRRSSASDEKEQAMAKAAKKAGGRDNRGAVPKKAAKKAASGTSGGGGNRKPGQESPRRKLKRLVVRKPKMTLDELTAKINTGGTKLSNTTISSIKSDTLDTVRVLIDEGILKNFALD